jgi:septum formation protein
VYHPPPVPLVLASASPRRADLLAAAGLAFTIRAVAVDESILPGEGVDAYVRRLAVAKARAAAVDDDEVVLGADTAVVVGEAILGKPRDAAEAAAMLRQLSGRAHDVVTGIALIRGARALVDTAVTRVVFHPLTEAEVAWYVASGEPRDKAGAYAVQGLASRFIARVEGSYANVVGLPVDLVCRHLPALGVSIVDAERTGT